MENEDKLRDYLKQVTARLRQTRQQLRDMKERDREPVAIVGMGCRFPGGVQSPEGLWELVSSGTDAISGFPVDRGWDAGGQVDEAGRQGGFIYDAGEFDAGFFGISPREALAMDPQQRLLLEVAWEAIERAGIDPSSLRGSKTGVFAGAAASEYGNALSGSDSSEGYVLTGTITSVISGRVSYTLGLEGPSVTIDTACSSSLVSLHLACQALRSGECTLALAGGVAVIAAPGIFAEFSRQGGLAADGRCKSFAAGADGTGWSEGAGMVVLERLSDAVRNGHPVLAVVSASAVNQDGASNGLTAPNGPSQQRVIRAALASAGLSTTDVDAVEAHGTGTALGDPIEAQALLATYGQGRPEDQPLWLGSVKSNIGHTAAAAGMAGVIKMVQALRHGMLPPTLHAGEPTSAVDWSAGAVRLLTEANPWAAGERPRRAGISAFGISGTNAHVILSEAEPAPAETEPGGDESGSTPADDSAPAQDSVPADGGALPLLDNPGVTAWPVSGRTPAGVRAQASRLAEWVAARPELDPADVAWSLAATRAALEHRAVVTGPSREELTAALTGLAAGEPSTEVVTGSVPPGGADGVAFVFPGQGGQWVGMGRELAARSPVFAARLAECGAALAPYVDWSLPDVLAGAEGAPTLEREHVLQPVLWAIMVSLAAVWEAAGVVPDAVAGSSQGEIAAACVAGMLSLHDGAKVVALRSQALAALVGRGGMLSVAESAEAVRQRAAGFGDRVSVAVVNSPATTVVSGEPGALAELAAACEAAGVRARMLPVDYASHSAQVEELREEIAAVLAGVTPVPGRVPMLSAVTGQWLEGPELDAGYWYTSLRSPVEFERVVRTLSASEYRVFVEVSPHPVLAAAIIQTLEDIGQETAGAVVTGTLRRDDGGPARLLASLAQAYAGGAAVDWQAVLGAGQRTELPTYAFQRQRFWPRAVSGASDVRSAGLGVAGHPLLGAAVEVASGQGMIFTGRLSAQAQPWLAEHVVGGTTLLAGTVFAELALAVGFRAGCGRLEELTLQAPLVLPNGGGVQVQVIVDGPGPDGQRPVEIFSRPDDAADVPWARHAAGLLAPAGPTPAAGDLAVWPPEGAEPVDVSRLYEELAAAGTFYGPVFRGLRAAWRRGSEVFAEAALPGDAAGYVVHPALLDAVMHATWLDGSQEPGGALRPFAWSGVSVHAAGATVLRARLDREGNTLSVLAADSAGAPVISVESLVLRPVQAGQIEAASAGLDALFSVEWVSLPVSDGPQPELGLAFVGADVPGASAYPDITALITGLAAGDPVPDAVLFHVGSGDACQPGGPAAVVGPVLEAMQQFLAAADLADARLVVLTSGAAAVQPGEGVADLAAAAAYGLVRSAQSENPGRLVLADVPTDSDAAGLLAAALAAGEPEVAVRDGALYARRLARPAGGLVPPPTGTPWRLVPSASGSLPDLALAEHPQAAAPLDNGQVRVAVRAAGLNFRDVMIALGTYPGAGTLGSEIAGVVVEAGPGVTGLVPGDRVMGLASGGFGPLAVTDARTLAPVPDGWSFTQAASLPVAFATAWYGLRDLAGGRPGLRLLVHAATGGVGMAAVAIARHLGLEVFATASPGKHAVLQAMGFDEDHIASSRDGGFEGKFLRVTGGAGVDIVLNSLAGELTDASLRLLVSGGVFLEIGKTDVRDLGQVADEHPGVEYWAFDLSEAGPARLGEILGELAGLMAAGELAVSPVRCWDVRRAPEAFRFMSQARHTGKLVLVVPADPAAPREPGTVLVTGGTGTLGGLVARHQAASGRARRVLLVSRSGPAAPGAARLAAEVAGAGAGVTVVACDAADQAALGQLLAGARVTGVVHAAGVLDDGIVTSLTPQRVETVMRAKADVAWNLHQLTVGQDLTEFVQFSSVAATLGGPGQGSYTAANAYLDALAAQRRAAGLPGTSIAWGTWLHRSGIGRNLSDDALARINRSDIAELGAEEGLVLMDTAAGRDDALLVAARLDVAGIRARAARGEDIPAVWRGLAPAAPRPLAAPAGPRTADGLAGQLAGLPGPEQDRLLTDLIRSHAAAVLGFASSDEVEPGRAFRDVGFDSLTAVELRNRLGAATGLRLPVTLVFDYPTPAAVARLVRTELLGEEAVDASVTLTGTPAAAGDLVAVVGMGCRFPGGVQDPDGLWELVASGTDAISGFPADRGWDAGQNGYSRRGGFMTGAAEFDAAFFGISPREALAMDPQQRLLLEVCWEALERAGIDPGTLGGSATGVFAGASHTGYEVSPADGEGVAGYLMTGTATSVISGRVSYLLGLEGPAVTVDTACSSALVALHLAAQALRGGECTLALAGGVTLIAGPGIFGEFSRQGGLAADGRCKSFAAGADGTGLAEGAGVLVLERLSDARRNGHPVLAVVAGSAVNQDGASNGLTAPNGPSQQRVIRAALASAGLAPADVDVVEAHGTGTVLGDPIEAQALLAAYGQDRPEGRPLWLGSVKSNIGHTQAAAGAAGLMKMVMALRHGTLPATLHADEPSPHIDWSAGSVRLLAEAVPWEAGDRPRRAGVSSFGISGTNAHAILAEAPAGDQAPGAGDSAEPGGGADAPLAAGVLAWPLSGRSAVALRAQAGRLAGFAAARPDLDAADIGWSLAATRSVMDHRAVVTGTSREELLAGLAAVAAGEPAPGAVAGAVPAGGAGRTVFVFAGHGAQWAGMGRELAAVSPVFAARLGECSAALAPWVDWSLPEVLAQAPGAPDLEREDVLQPALWAVSVALAAVWEAAGIVPDAVAGHSQGEIAAACAAGMLSLEDGARVAALRGRALTGLAGGGGMLSVAEPAGAVRERIAGFGGRLSVAVVNSPASAVVSGDLDALAELAAACEAAGVRTRPVPIGYASHSPQVEAAREELIAALEGITPVAGRVPMVSSVTGQWLAGPELDPGYWYAGLRSPVEFARTVTVLGEAGYGAFIEVSPHPALTTAVTQTLDAARPDGPPAVVTGTLRRDDGGAPRLLDSLARAHAGGVTADWKKVLGPGRAVELPTYAFQRQRFWPKPAVRAAVSGGDGSGSAGEARFWAAVEGGDVAALARTLALREDERLAELLPALASWRRQERDRSATEGWQYRISWVPVPGAEQGSPVLSGVWLVVVPSGMAAGLAGWAADALAGHGARPVLVELGAGELGVDELGRAAVAGRVGAVLEGREPSGVVSLLALAEDAGGVVPAGLAGTAGLVQGLADAGVGAPLWVLTCGAVAAVPGDVVGGGAQASVWGLGLTAALEFPERWGGLVDVPGVPDDRAGRRLCAVLAGCGEDQAAVRAGGVFGRRLVRAGGSAGGRAWVPRGTVLVTGGTGWAGGYVARWAAGRGASRVVLSSRSGPGAAGVAGLAAGLAGSGTAVEVVACDIADRDQAAGLVARAGATLSSILHAAGQGARLGTVPELTDEELTGVLGAKAVGAQHLDELTTQLDLDAFVLFSSGAGTWGSALQGGYAAANAYLDGLAQSRRARGLAGTSVAWGLWGGGGGMGAGVATTQLERLGVREMDPRQAAQALGAVLDSGECLMAVTDVDWAQFTPVFTARRDSPLITGVPEAAQALSAAADGTGLPDSAGLAGQLAAMSAAERDRMLTDLVRSHAAAVLGHASADAVEAGRAFKEVGFDSLTAVELRNRLGAATGLRLPATLVFDYPTPAAVARLIRGELLGEQETVIPTASVVRAADDEPLAIVGMGCRFPGGVRDPQGLWDLVASGTDAISEFPADRGWDDAVAADGGQPSYARLGGFLREVAEFDAGFFGISPREALAMDPQQRLLLEVSWEAIERAGINPAALRGSATGVFAGASHSGYDGGGEGTEGYLLTGASMSVISGRVSYLLGLEGPAVTVDTACSSALVALHLAAQALRSGECTLALAGGVTVIAAPGIFGEFSRQGGLAADGRCKSFAADADGTGWGEGAGMLVLERLSDARRNGHPVLAVVAGSAVNQDGASNGLTAPNGPSQQRVIRAALAGAGFAPADVDVVEAHGTGTVLGDPIEAQALLAAYGQDRPEGRPLWLGSVKSNIGHTQASAGAAGLMKMVMALRHGTLPRSLHAEEPSPHIDWSAGQVRLLTEAVPWEAGDRPRRAGVSSFGISGTNAHVILAEAPAGDQAPGAGDSAEPGGGADAPLAAGVLAWPVSGRSAVALRAQAGRLAGFAAARPDLDAADIGWSLAATRSVMDHRAVVTGTSREELLAGLAAVAAGEPAPGAVAGAVPAGGAGRTVFVFAGHGAQWAGMGRELAAVSPVFAARLGECSAALAPWVDWSLPEVLAQAPGAPDLEREDVLQPALWAVSVALAAVWEAAGIVPDAVAGHSQGEIAAACTAGMLSLEDGARVAALRGRALTGLAGGGGMVSVAEPAGAVRERIAGFGGRLSVAVVNSPASAVVSGDLDALAELAAACEAAGVRTRPVPIGYASHSPQVEAAREELIAALEGITPVAGRVPMVSSVTGQWLAGPELDPGYWYAGLRSPVEFARTVTVLGEAGYGAFIEVSPHPALTTAVTQTLDAARPDGPPAVVTGTLRRDDGGAPRLLDSLARAHAGGVTADWKKVLGPGRAVELPTYAFQRQRFWPRGGAGAGDVRSAGLGAAAHPLLGAAVELAGGQGLVLTGGLSAGTQPWLADHVVGGTILLPGTALADLALAAGQRAGCGRLEELTLQAPLVIGDGSAVQVQVMAGPAAADGRRVVEVFSRAGDDGDGPWTRHAAGTLAPETPAPAAAPADLATWPPQGAEPVDVTRLYQDLAAGGYGYGPAFQGLRAAWRRGSEVFAEVTAPADTVDPAGYGVHPALLDAVLHAAGLAAADGAKDAGVLLPFSWQGVTVHAAGATVLRARLTRAGDTLSLTAADGAGVPVITVESLALRPVQAGQIEAARSGAADALFSVEWVSLPGSPEAGRAPARWAVAGQAPRGLAEGLAAAGADVRRYPDLAALAEAAAAGGPVPEVVVAGTGDTGSTAAGDPAPGLVPAGTGNTAPGTGGPAAVTGRVLETVQQFLAAGELADARLVVLTRGAAQVLPGETVTDLAGAAAAGLVRSAQTENPGRLMLADLPAAGAGGAEDAGLAGLVAGVLASGEPEVAVRDGVLYGRRLARPRAGLVPPAGGMPWRLEPSGTGSLQDLVLGEYPDAAAALADHEVRVAVRAGGLNFRDVMIALGMYPGAAVLGSEIAGIVTEAGPGVSHLAPGDRVMGLAGGGFGPLAVTDARMLAPVPDGWSFARAAAVPVAFGTAWYGLRDLAAARPGQRLLVHAATGGVGMAAVTIARHLGLEVFATASPGKHPLLRSMGFDEDHIASSRDAGFEDKFLAVTGGAGLDIVLNALAGELTDASLRLLAPGGTFLEMGKTDLRDPARLAQDHPGTAYRPFDLSDAGPERTGEILAAVTALLAAGELTASPVRAWDIRRAPEAFRFMSQARHTGKLVLTVPADPAAPREAGTVLVTGGTGTLGGLVARHLASTGQAREVLLTSRTGPAAPGAARLAAEVAASGAQVKVAACDAADRDALEQLLEGVPLSGVVHAAGVLDDGIVSSLTPARVEAVMRAKASSAWNLHEVTAGRDLDAFVLFSSVAGVTGSAGQGSYAAANACLDALAARRRAAGLPAVSVAWGLWERASGMTGRLSGDERARISRGGVSGLGDGEGLALLDVAAGRDEALLVAARLDVAGLRARAARGEEVPAVWRGLAGAVARPVAAAVAGGLAGRLAGLPAGERDRLVTGLVCSHAAAVLGHGSAEAVEPGRAFKDLGFDSLTAVELRNRLGAATGLRLPATLVFDYPTPAAVAGLVRAELLGGQGPAAAAAVPAAAAGGELVAVVGMGCRFPGGVRDPQGLWDLVASGTDAIGGFPADRGWESAADGYARQGGFLRDAGEFDAGFFGISPREALSMDPQQRLLLEVCWEALERAGIDPGTLRGTAAGVYAGASSSGYAPGGQAPDGYLLTGSTTSVISGRVAYLLGLEGPAVTVDTACSSALVALHLAAQALRGGECTLALAGGVTVMATPGIFADFSRQGGLAGDGRCKPFAAGADGTGWGEGAGMLVLERLTDARRNGHEVLAVLAGSAVNQDGASNGLTAPNGPSQQRVIRAALAAAGLGPADVDAVEAHGTGTALGDPIEAQALLATYGQDRPGGQPLWLGSVKSNIGHTQCAAGAAGLIKMVMALRHGTLPASLHAGEPTPTVDWSAGQVRLLAEAVPWEGNGRPRRAGVSSFGISGTNAHAILAEPPADHQAPGTGDSGPSAPLAAGVLAWPLSGRSAVALRAQAGRLAGFAAARPDLDAADIGWSLAATRSVMDHRAVVTGTSREELLAGLAAVAAGEPAPGAVAGAVPAGGAGRTVFVFAGHGAQWAGMGRELAAVSPVFAARLGECSAALAPWVDWSLPEVLAQAPGAPDLEREDVLQPALWAVSVALAAVWEAAGIVPDAVAGHSQGEIAAACTAGMLSLEDGARVAALRGRALTGLAGGGGMLSVAEPAGAVRERIAGFGGRLSVAVVNSPASAVVSGDLDALAELAAACEAAGVRTRPVPIGYASHSPQVEAAREELIAALEGITPVAGRVPMVSSVTGQWLAGPELDPGYWYAGLRSPVEFARTVTVLGEAGYGAFIEVSPHPALTTAVTQTLDAARPDGPPAVVTGTLRRDDGGAPRLLDSLARAHAGGVTADWKKVLGPGRAVELPTYAFQRQRFWPRGGAGAGDVRSAGLGAAAHPLLGAAVELAGGQGLVLTGRLSAGTQPWLADHVVGGTILLPGTALADLALAAGQRAGCGRLEELTLQAPLVIGDGSAVQVQVMAGPAAADGRRVVEVFSRAGDDGDGPWTRHAAGTLAPETPAPAAAPADLATWPPQGAEPVDVTRLYQDLAAGGYGYGPAFQGLRAAWRRGSEVFAEVTAPADTVDPAGYGVHPALLDAVLHAAGLAAADGAKDAGVLLPFSWQGVTVHAAGATVLRARLTRAGDTLSLTAADGAGVPVITVESLALRPVQAGQIEAARSGAADALFSVEWTPVPLPGKQAEAEPRLAVVGEAGPAAGTGTPVYPDLAALAAAVTAGDPVPDLVLASTGPGDPAAVTGQVLETVQQFLADSALADARLAIVTRGAAQVLPGETVTDLAGAAAAGLVRSAQSENPGRLVLADLPAAGDLPSLGAVGAGGGDGAGLAGVLASGEPEVAVRDGVLYGRRLARPAAGLVPPGGGAPWRLQPSGSGSLDGLALAPCPEASAPLADGQVRVAVRAGGLNFRDVMIALGMYPGAAVLGSEIAGIVTEAGPGVSHLVPGDRVMGLATGGFGPLAVVDARSLALVPGGWSFAQAAAVPVAFATAWYGLRDLAAARPGQRLLVHAATGGVGMAAVTIARHLGLEVFATASPAKHPLLRSMGFDEDHIASSRDAGFEDKFRAGVDIVLNALAGELTDASLRLLAPGGTFLEMGKTDLRDPARLVQDHPGTAYRPFDLSDAGPERTGEMLRDITALLAAGELTASPVRAWDIRRAVEAFRFMSQARHTGKLVLTVPADPAAPRQAGTVLVTGGTGALGALVARHLAGTGQAREVLLTSRTGPAASGVSRLAAEVAASGAQVTVAACDTADRDALEQLIREVPLTGVIHAAGVLDDGMIGSLTPAQIETVMRAKADSARNLDQLTRHSDLQQFTLFSSVAGVTGAPGQGSYAAANCYLDALAARRRSAGLPAMSVAWGLWEDAGGGMTGQLSGDERARISRGPVAGLATGQALALLDTVTGRDESVLTAARLDIAGLRASAARGEDIPALWRGLAGTAARPLAAAGMPGQGLAGQLAGLSPADRDRLLTDLVRSHAAAVLGHASAEAVESSRAFRDLGFDSLTGVELRNRLNSATGLRLTATLVFDYPTPADVARYLLAEIEPAASDPASSESALRQALAAVPLSRFREAGIMEALLSLAGLNGETASLGDEEVRDIDALDAESLVRLALDQADGDSE